MIGWHPWPSQWPGSGLGGRDQPAAARGGARLLNFFFKIGGDFIIIIKKLSFLVIILKFPIFSNIKNYFPFNII